MIDLNKIESNFLRFYINGRDVEIDALPRVSEKTQRVMQGFHFQGPQLSVELRDDYISRARYLEGQKRASIRPYESTDYERGLFLTVVGVGFIAAGILLALSNAPFLAVAFGNLLGSTLSFVGFGFMRSTDVVKQKLKILKPQAQQYIENFARYYQTHGPKLQEILEQALRREQENFARTQWMVPNQDRINVLQGALEEIQWARAIALSFGEEIGMPSAPLLEQIDKK